MADYCQHWLDMEEKLTNPPIICNVNWFRTDDQGQFQWPGFGENLRVVEWVLRRAFGEAEAVETPIGYMPRPEDIDLEGTGVSQETLQELLTIDPDLWKAECRDIRAFYAGFGEKLPEKLRKSLDELESRLG